MVGNNIRIYDQILEVIINFISVLKPCLDFSDSEFKITHDSIKSVTLKEKFITFWKKQPSELLEFSELYVQKTKYLKFIKVDGIIMLQLGTYDPKNYHFEYNLLYDNHCKEIWVDIIVKNSKEVLDLIYFIQLLMIENIIDQKKWNYYREFVEQFSVASDNLE